MKWRKMCLRMRCVCELTCLLVTHISSREGVVIYSHVGLKTNFVVVEEEKK